jgi:hypothetical protein
MRIVRQLAFVGAVTAAVAAVVGLIVSVLVPRYFSSSTGAASSEPPQVPRYFEEALAAGVEHSYTGDFDYVVGGGVAAFDCNADLLPDLYLAGGSTTAGLFVNRSAAGQPLRFERQAGEVTDVDSVTGAYPIDVDSDAITDLVVLRRGENLMLRGLGGCRFERANEAWGFVGGDRWTTAFSAKWDGGSGWPTVALGNYVDESSEDVNRLCFNNELLPPAANGRGFGTPVSLSPGWCALSMLFTDWDRSGRRDLRVSNDRHYYRDTGDGAEQLWRIETGSPPRQYTDAEGWRRLRIWGMGIASHDVTGDGYPDYYLTSQSDNKLQVLADGPGRPTYEDIALRRGAIATRPYEGDTSLPSTAWHDQFEDVNNDGLIDLFVAKGNVDAQPDHAARDPSNLLIGQPDGTFSEGAVEAGLLDYGQARGGAVIDLNADGMLDLVVVDRRENVRLYRNVGSGTAEAPMALGNWIEVRLVQEGVNRDAIGAWIEVRVGERLTTRELTVGGGHVSGQLGPCHFGLGSATSAEVRVTWPDGEVGPWQLIQANQATLIQR